MCREARDPTRVAEVVRMLKTNDEYLHFKDFLCIAVDNGHTACFQWLWWLFPGWCRMMLAMHSHVDTVIQFDTLVHDVTLSVGGQCEPLHHRARAADGMTLGDVGVYAAWFRESLIRQIVDGDLETNWGGVDTRRIRRIRAVCIMTEFCLARTRAGR